MLDVLQSDACKWKISCRGKWGAPRHWRHCRERQGQGRVYPPPLPCMSHIYNIWLRQHQTRKSMNNTIKNQTKAGDALPPLSYSWNGKCTCCSTACSTWRLECLGLCSLEERRNRSDIIEVFKMAKGSSAFPLECIFQLSTTKHLRLSLIHISEPTRPY